MRSSDNTLSSDFRGMSSDGQQTPVRTSTLFLSACTACIYIYVHICAGAGVLKPGVPLCLCCPSVGRLGFTPSSVAQVANMAPPYT